MSEVVNVLAEGSLGNGFTCERLAPLWFEIQTPEGEKVRCELEPSNKKSWELVLTVVTWKGDALSIIDSLLVVFDQLGLKNAFKGRS